MSILIQNLTKLGLSDKESSAYLALLELGEASIGQISKKSGIKRTTLYDIINSLIKSGLVGSIQKGARNSYFAEDPRKLEETFEERERLLKIMLPELLSLANTIDKKPKIKYYEGIAGIREVYRDTLQYEDQELLAWVAEEALDTLDEDFLNTEYVSKRLEKKIWVRAIAPNVTYMEQYKGMDTASLRTTRLIDAKKFPFEVEINLYGKTKIGVMSFGEGIGLIIESAKIFRTLQSIFELQWELLADTPNR